MLNKAKKLLRFVLSTKNYISPEGLKIKELCLFGLKIKIALGYALKPLDNSFTENPPVYLSVVAIAKNEAPYIKEWLEYHKLVGVERFYFYDNESDDNTREILEPYIRDGLVVYNYCKGRCMQNKAYADAIYKYKFQTRWLAIIDLDEFIVPTEKDSIPDFLKDYEDYPAVGINWVMFDSNGHKARPARDGGLVTVNYTRTSSCDSELHIKSIVNPQRVLHIPNPHCCLYKSSENAVNENFEKIESFLTNSHSVAKIRINHYYSKSEEEYMRKSAGRNADNNRKRKLVKELLNFKEATNDNAVFKYVPKLKKRLGINDGE